MCHRITVLLSGFFIRVKAVYVASDLGLGHHREFREGKVSACAKNALETILKVVMALFIPGSNSPRWWLLVISTWGRPASSTGMLCWLPSLSQVSHTSQHQHQVVTPSWEAQIVLSQWEPDARKQATASAWWAPDGRRDKTSERWWVDSRASRETGTHHTVPWGHSWPLYWPPWEQTQVFLQ